MARAVANVFSLAKDKSTVLLALNYHNGSKTNLVTVAFAWGGGGQNKRCRQQKVLARRRDSRKTTENTFGY